MKKITLLSISLIFLNSLDIITTLIGLHYFPHNAIEINPNATPFKVNTITTKLATTFIFVILANYTYVKALRDSNTKFIAKMLEYLLIGLNAFFMGILVNNCVVLIRCITLF